MSSYNDLLSPNIVAPDQDYPSAAQWNALLAELRPQRALMSFRDPVTPFPQEFTTTPVLLDFYTVDGFAPEAPNNQLIANASTGEIKVQRTTYSKEVGQSSGLLAEANIEVIAAVASGGNVVLNFELYADGVPTGLVFSFPVVPAGSFFSTIVGRINIPDGVAISIFAYTSSGTVTLDFSTFSAALVKIPLGVKNAILTVSPEITPT